MRVIPATPMTLLALLRAIAYGWTQQQVARNAEEIQLLGRDLYERLATMVEHLSDVGRGMKQAADSYDRFIGSLETKVLPAARPIPRPGRVVAEGNRAGGAVESVVASRPQGRAHGQFAGRLS